MKKLIYAILFLFFMPLIFSGEEVNNLFKKVLIAEQEARSPNKASQDFRAKYRNGFLKKNSEVEIQCGDEVVKVVAVDGFFVSRKIIFRGEEINLYRLELNSFDIAGQYGIYDPAKNLLSGKKINLHIIYKEYFNSYKTLSHFKEYTSLYNEYCAASGKKFLSYHDEKGMECAAIIVEDKKYNVIHLSIYVSKILIDWEETNKLPPSPFKPNFKIVEQKK